MSNTFRKIPDLKKAEEFDELINKYNIMNPN